MACRTVCRRPKKKKKKKACRPCVAMRKRRRKYTVTTAPKSVRARWRRKAAATRRRNIAAELRRCRKAGIFKVAPKQTGAKKYFSSVKSPDYSAMSAQEYSGMGKPEMSVEEYVGWRPQASNPELMVLHNPGRRLSRRAARVRFTVKHRRQTTMRKGKKRGWKGFFKKHRRAGKSAKEIGRMWRKCKGTVTRKRRRKARNSWRGQSKRHARAARRGWRSRRRSRKSRGSRRGRKSRKGSRRRSRSCKRGSRGSRSAYRKLLKRFGRRKGLAKWRKRKCKR